jgi:hypothetical protein
LAAYVITRSWGPFFSLIGFSLKSGGKTLKCVQY